MCFCTLPGCSREKRGVGGLHRGPGALWCDPLLGNLLLSLGNRTEASVAAGKLLSQGHVGMGWPMFSPQDLSS